MNYGPLIFLSAFLALASSWFGLVLAPQLQVGRLQTTNTLSAEMNYPVTRPGFAREGLDVYRANGCAYCHSQQAGQTATVCDVVLTEAGTNKAALIAALRKVRPEISEPEAGEWTTKLPKSVLEGVKRAQADAAVSELKVGDAKAELHIVPVGPDIARNWGKRRSVAEDFLYDYPVMLGEQRVGPDLSNVGLRLPEPNWHLLHLYAPQLQVKGSAMPPYRYLFETRKIERAPAPDALALPAGFAPRPGYEIVPTAEAKALVAYLASLRANADLFVAPLTVPAAPPASTNAPPASGGATNVALTNIRAAPFTAEELNAIPERK